MALRGYGRICYAHVANQLASKLSHWKGSAMAANKQHPPKADGGRSKTILPRNNGGNQKDCKF